MSWLDKIKEYAPDIALAFATGGTSAIKSVAVRMLAKELTGDPSASVEDVKGVVEGATPEQMIALTELNNTFTLERDRIESDNLRVINETMRGEAKSDHWVVYSWRPFIGYITGLAFITVCVFVCWLTWQAISSKDMNAMQMIPQVIFNFTTLFAIPGGILGLASHHRGKEKRLKAGENQLDKF